MATMVNMNSLLNGKDSRWLQLEVCREFQRNKCSRPDTECKFAHPPATVEVQNGRVTACYDSIKGRCNREKPPCKYFHPPQHLKDQLLINGRNHLALKNALMQQMGLTPGQVLPGQVPAVVGGVSGAGAAASHIAALDPISLALLAPQATSPYLSGVPGVGSTYAQYYAPQLVPAVLGHDPSAAAASPLGVMQQPVLQQKLPRTDRLEVCREFLRGACKRAESECRFAHPPPPVVAHDDGCVTVCMDAVKGRCVRDPCRYFHPPLHLQAHLKAQARGAMDMKSVGSFYYDNFAFPGVVPYKRQAADKAGVPVYQPATTYQQLMQLQQPFVPVSCEYPAPASSAPPAAVTAVSGAAGPQTAPAAAPLPQAGPPPAAQPAPPAPASPPVSVADAAVPDPAAVAKEVAHKNYAAALALAAQHSAMAHAAAAYTQQAFKARAAMPGLMRAPLMMRPGWPAPPVPMPAFYQQPYMYAMPPPAAPSAAAAAAAAAAAVNPYKKMKTT
ncbi:muscleblind-like protein 3 isoform X1 [Danaus plexippus]|uniref:muscleblind-like protein 3 isoform X1 n=1 Tax=Danaus plexippus TaxID=13037 RepID=UPI002AB1B786|nr:muscleblind-like protein 3 isoform X1 [Danaus plexippus]XP_061378851.1 muscleblind-like protein 3 isoform X1 [Danaus plexippus]XP_061378854.1 muscleblind-like protein 3 isoform X1 [Danaus plexippus]XP_061378860.1 muscleblind-like protein 3 isoform X1 [Danaus plexippus]